MRFTPKDSVVTAFVAAVLLIGSMALGALWVAATYGRARVDRTSRTQPLGRTPIAHRR
jgi:hypothetical protein